MRPRDTTTGHSRRNNPALFLTLYAPDCPIEKSRRTLFAIPQTLLLTDRGKICGEYTPPPPAILSRQYKPIGYIQTIGKKEPRQTSKAGLSWEELIRSIRRFRVYMLVEAAPQCAGNQCKRCNDQSPYRARFLLTL